MPRRRHREPWSPIQISAFMATIAQAAGDRRTAELHLLNLFSLLVGRIKPEA